MFLNNLYTYQVKSQCPSDKIIYFTNEKNQIKYVYIIADILADIYIMAYIFIF